MTIWRHAACSLHRWIGCVAEGGRPIVLLLLCIVASGAAAPAAAQTGLLAVARRAEASRLEEAMARVRWPYGPAAVGTLEDYGARLQSLSAAGVRAVIVVPVGIGGDLMPSARDAGPGVTIRVTASVATRPETPGRAARRVERAAAAAMLGVHGDRPYQLGNINVTATREARDGLRTPSAVSVFTAVGLVRQGADNAADAFRHLPGLDVAGVGTNQHRPVIRGLSGHRILLLQDGVRLNNSRRRQESGEPPALVGSVDVERVEVVRGPASVLYGSGAIGGVVNIVTRRPEYAAADEVHGRAGYRYGTAGDQSSPFASVSGRVGGLTLRAAGDYRNSAPYDAPQGRFGGVAFARDTRVQDTGVEDYTLSAYAGYRFSDRHAGFVKLQRYQADHAGFGFVDPADIGFVDPAAAEELPTVQLLWPHQRFDRLSGGYNGTGLGLPVADEVAVVAYAQSNERQFNTNILSTLGAPGTELIVESENFTDVDTRGFRAEAKKFLGAVASVTYGIDYFRDHSTNTDTSTTTIIGLGPTTVRGRGTEPVPTATFRSAGAFAQAEIMIANRATLSLGGRYQDVRARTLETPGVSEPLVDAVDRTVVGGGSLVFEVARNLNAVASVGRAFRSPNLVERFFSGPAPEGRAVWVRNTDLKAETSLNAEIGVKYGSDAVHLEGFAFRNTVYDAIRREPTGNEVNGRTELRNVNVEELRFAGVEASVGVRLLQGLWAMGHVTHIDATNVRVPEDPVGESYSDKIGGRLRYDDSGGRFWVEYHVRHNGARSDVELTGPVGEHIPAFTVHGVRGGIVVARNQRLDLAVNNLTNVLYAEASNVGFFRPEPKRNLVVTMIVGF